ncbi:MAG: cytochrome C [Gammaproteobacteria bacterium TMED243]|jgi:NADPH-dependent 2,4-dienoyl-CoA reductase/sulfur reductase-like enzyme|nr:cytochrome C [Gammaproteobacteria bacterium]RPG30278.1 MAG: cytochrome C [Gammaproteobacteria bacterium TMED243]
MKGLRRRHVLAAMAASALLPGRTLAAEPNSRLVVVGGGFAGATLARSVKRLSPEITVVLIEARERYVSCPMSNLVIAGRRSLAAQTFDYRGLEAAGVEVVRGMAVDVDATKQCVRLQGGVTIDYDRLVLAPGVMLNFDQLSGMSEQGAEKMPHAWQAGAQTTLLRRQIEAMPDDGLVVISVPAAPYRCPPGPYERASLITSYLKQNKPKAQILILDSNERFSKQALFQQGWKHLYGDRIRWQSASNDGRVIRVEPDAMRLHTDFATHTPDVANIIPPQQAGLIAHRAGVADASGWCPVNSLSFESRLQPNIHVIGDAAIAAPMPKSAFAANAQAKVCAIALVRLFRGMQPQSTVLANTCYSYLEPNSAISISGAYRTQDGQFASIAAAAGASPLIPPEGLQAQEALHAADWFRAITQETFG